MAKRLDLAGTTFGKLTVVGPAESIGGGSSKRTAWRCRCECGREVVVKTCRLRSGRAVDCGCVSGMDADDRGHRQKGAAARNSLTLVDGTCVEMIRASTVRCNNTSGVPGVDWLARKQRWRATICFKGKRHYLGSYADFDDAVAARRRGEETYYEPFLREHPGPPR